MREIKFRAWNPDSKTMSYMGHLQIGANSWVFFNDEASVAYSDRSKLMQYTGLIDKNRKEIYQGDLLMFTNPEGESFYQGIAEVTAKSCGYSFNPIPDLTEHEMMINCYDSSMFWHRPEEDIEVIGNIYEHPHLLEKQDEK